MATWSVTHPPWTDRSPTFVCVNLIKWHCAKYFEHRSKNFGDKKPWKRLFSIDFVHLPYNSLCMSTVMYRDFTQGLNCGKITGGLGFLAVGVFPKCDVIRTCVVCTDPQHKIWHCVGWVEKIAGAFKLWFYCKIPGAVLWLGLADGSHSAHP